MAKPFSGHIMDMKNGLSSWTIAATYVGTVVGAAFASGQEILQFFGFFGLWGLPGLLVTTVLLVVFGYLLMDAGRRLQAESYLPVIKESAGPWLGRALDGVITFFLFGALLIMAAGAGAFFRQHFGLPFALGSALMVLAAWGTVLAGLGGVIAAISVIAPLLLASVLGLGAFTLAANWRALPENLLWSFPARAPIPFWPLSALVYASYNLILAVAVLVPLGRKADAPRLLRGAVGGGVALGLAATTIYLAVLVQGKRVTGYELPMLAVAASAGPAVATGYGLMLLAEIYTTAVSSLYGFGSRLAAPTRPFWVVVSLAGGASFVLAQFGFSKLVATIFPAVGYAGLLLIGSLSYRAWGKRGLALVMRQAGLRPAYKKPLEEGANDKGAKTAGQLQAPAGGQDQAGGNG